MICPQDGWVVNWAIFEKYFMIASENRYIREVEMARRVYMFNELKKVEKAAKQAPKPVRRKYGAECHSCVIEIADAT
jgi:hypothetical protein